MNPVTAAHFHFQQHRQGLDLKSPVLGHSPPSPRIGLYDWVILCERSLGPGLCSSVCSVGVGSISAASGCGSPASHHRPMQGDDPRHSSIELQSRRHCRGASQVRRSPGRPERAQWRKLSAVGSDSHSNGPLGDEARERLSNANLLAGDFHDCRRSGPPRALRRHRRPPSEARTPSLVENIQQRMERCSGRRSWSAGCLAAPRARLMPSESRDPSGSSVSLLLSGTV
jgi:hypothetical protein